MNIHVVPPKKLLFYYALITKIIISWDRIFQTFDIPNNLTNCKFKCVQSWIVTPGNGSWLYVVFPSHKIIGSPVWYHVWLVWLFPIILIILGWPSVSYHPSLLPPQRWYEVRTSPSPSSTWLLIKFDMPPPSSYCFVGGVMSGKIWL